MSNKQIQYHLRIDEALPQQASTPHRSPKSLYFNKPMAIRLQNGRVSLPQKSMKNKAPKASIYTKTKPQGGLYELKRESRVVQEFRSKPWM